MPRQLNFKVRLNGTNENPFHRLGLTQNPFPQLPIQEYVSGILTVQKLGGDPIPDTNYIRNVLQGFSEEFVDLCCQRFRPGEMVEFDVYFQEG